MANIVIDARNINSSTGRYAERLVHFLEEDTANDYTVLVLKKDINYYKPTNPKFKVVGVDYDWYSLREQFGMARFLSNLKPDLVHFTMPHHPVLFFRPYITTFHDLILLNTYNSDKNFFIFKFKQFIGRFVYLAMARGARALITPTKYVKGELVKFSCIKPQKVSVTYEGCETTTTEPKTYKPLVGKRYIMYLGQQSDYKNIRRLMQAHQLLRKDHPELLLVLVGRLSGKNGAPLQTNREWGIQQGFKGIVFTDFLPDAEALWVKKHSLAYVFPSLMEGFGLPALEAMQAGTPVVSSNASCLPEVYGDAAIYFDPTNVDEMAEKINMVITNKALRKQMVKKGFAQAKKYSWRRMAQETLALYKKVLSQ